MHALASSILWWSYDDDNMPSLLQKFLNFSEIKFVPASENILLGSLYSEKIILYVFTRSSVRPSTCFMMGNLLWISSMQQWWFFLFIVKMSAPTDSHSLPHISYGIILSFSCVVWKSRYGAVFNCLFYVGICVDKYLESHTRILVLLCPYDWYVPVLVPCIVVMRVKLFFFLWWQSHLWLLIFAWMSNMNCSSLCTSAFVDGQQQGMGSAYEPRCSSLRVAIFYFFCCHAVWHVCELLCCIVCVWWLCLDSQSVTNSCGPGL